MFGQLFLAIAFVALGTAYFLGFSVNNKFAKTLPEEYKRTYLRKVAGLFYLCAIFIACMAFVERYEALTGAIYIFVYILGGCVLAILAICLKRKYTDV